jgi:hypothetical protein
MPRIINTYDGKPIDAFDDELVEVAGRRLGVWLSNSMGQSHTIVLEPDNGTQYLIIVTRLPEGTVDGPFVVSLPRQHRAAALDVLNLPQAAWLRRRLQLPGGIADVLVLERLFHHARNTYFGRTT